MLPFPINIHASVPPIVHHAVTLTIVKSSRVPLSSLAASDHCGIQGIKDLATTFRTTMLLTTSIVAETYPFALVLNAYKPFQGLE
jgi:hypothetical protein